MKLSTLILISSFLISFKGDKKEHKEELPNFRNILEVKHSIPGRIRLQCKDLKENLNGKEALINTFSQIKGVSEVSVNPCIGTILIKYNPNIIEPILIIGVILKVLGLDEEVKDTNKSLVTRESAEILNSVSHAIYEKTNGILDLKASVMIFILSYAIYDIKTRPGLRPSGLTCLWWMYSFITRPH